MSALEDVDLRALDVLQKSRRKRHRAKPAPDANLVADKPGALKRAQQRPLNPGVIMEPGKGDAYVFASPHADPALWEMQLSDAFGTRSMSVIRTFLAHLNALVPDAWDTYAHRWKTNETELNAALAMVADVRPRNVREAALAAQMVAVHLMQMKLSASALNRGGMVMERDAALASKLARTFAIQLEALDGLRGKRRSTTQKIKVTRENHVHYHDHRGGAGTEAQPHEARAVTIEGSNPLPSEEPGGEVVRLPSRSGPRSVS